MSEEAQDPIADHIADREIHVSPQDRSRWNEGAKGEDGKGVSLEDFEPSDEPGGASVATIRDERTGRTVELVARNGLPGEAGPQGERGPQGETGPQGEPGADGAVSWSDLTPEQKEELKEELRGPEGERGGQGDPGVDGSQWFVSLDGDFDGDTEPGGEPGHLLDVEFTRQDRSPKAGDMCLIESLSMIFECLAGVGEEYEGETQAESLWRYVLEITGPRGAVGPQGPQGPQGQKGDKGDTGDSVHLDWYGISRSTPSSDTASYVLRDHAINILSNLDASHPNIKLYLPTYNNGTGSRPRALIVVMYFGADVTMTANVEWRHQANEYTIKLLCGSADELTSISVSGGSYHVFFLEEMTSEGSSYRVFTAARRDFRTAVVTTRG